MAATASPVDLPLGKWVDVELSGTPGTKTVLVATNRARYYSLRPVGNAAKLFEPAAGGTDYSDLPADTLRSLRVPGSGRGAARNMDTSASVTNSRRIEVSSLTASLIVQVKASED